MIRSGRNIKAKIPLIKNEIPVISFESNEEWTNWLEQNQNCSKGIWLRFYKKDSGITSISHDEALATALCYGWIDGQLDKYDSLSYLHKFTPRSSKSIWSKKNIEIVLRLEKDGKIKPSGMKQIKDAKADGRWEKAYDSQSNMTLPDDFLNELAKNKKALAFYETLNKANKYAIFFRLQTAKKPETRQKRLITILDKLSTEKKFH